MATATAIIANAKEEFIIVSRRGEEEKRLS